MVTFQDLEIRITQLNAAIRQAEATEAAATLQKLRQELMIAQLALSALKSGIHDG